jgi:hypothetical protein
LGVSCNRPKVRRDTRYYGTVGVLESENGVREIDTVEREREKGFANFKSGRRNAH